MKEKGRNEFIFYLDIVWWICAFLFVFLLVVIIILDFFLSFDASFKCTIFILKVEIGIALMALVIPFVKIAVKAQKHRKSRKRQRIEF